MKGRVTVIRADNVVYIDGVAEHDVDCSDLPDYFHALQWYGDADPPYGEIEYATDASGRKLPNTRFHDVGAYQFLVNRRALKREARLADEASRSGSEKERR
jgi:hypothetical protein